MPQGDHNAAQEVKACPSPYPRPLSNRQVAADKADSLRKPGRYLVSSSLAAPSSGWGGAAAERRRTSARRVVAVHQASSKGWCAVALTLVVFAGAELTTSNMMTMVQGAIARRCTVGNALAVIVGSFVGNLVGSVLFAWLVHGSGVITPVPPRDMPPRLSSC
ncbi:hypothetical protein E4K10_39865 [Streptomyces sp. T1317-0309]|nr:hypothetical protein E4K10_39865 [Streptomyces sp. T1317-0309]